MKKEFLLGAMVCALGMHAIGQSPMISNPAAQYCVSLGYDYMVVKDSTGAEHGICVFPDSSTADEWSFYRGECKSEYSYCARMGLSQISIVDSSNGLVSRCAYCVTKDRSRVTVRDMMIQNGDFAAVQEQESFYENSSDDYEDSVYISNRLATSFPSSFDWRAYNGHSYVNPIRDQGNTCGACYAFATVASAEGVFNFDWGLYDENRIELSESFIMWCLGSKSEYYPYFHGCWGTTNHRAEVAALTSDGVCLRHLFPYQTTQPDSCYHWNDTKVKFSGWYRIACNDIASMKDAIMKYGVISTLTYTDDRFENYHHGIFKNNDTQCPGTPCGFKGTNHVVAIVGWGKDENEGEYWIVRNSWGSGWGENGYMRIGMTSAKIACNAAVLIPEPSTYISSDYANHSSTIISGHNAKTIASGEIVLAPGFEAAFGSEYVAEIQPMPTIPPTVIDFSAMADIGNQNTKSASNIENIIQFDNLSVCPNPVHSFISISGISDISSIKVLIYTITGSLLMTSIDSHIDLSQLPQGIYIVKVETKEKQVQ
ncbi:MAG: DUF333 domain-containing protein [Bacteroidales bacterium]|nr:DUF333 domain-containing protein [Bacteroidales bacterium]MBR3413380.1 DUF333 domain-containing protein [Bacteroidales bacterium]